MWFVVVLLSIGYPNLQGNQRKDCDLEKSKKKKQKEETEKAKKQMKKNNSIEKRREKIQPLCKEQDKQKVILLRKHKKPKERVNLNSRFF